MVTLADYHIFLVYSHIFVFSFLVHLEIYEDRQFFLYVQETRLYYLKVLIFHRNRHKVNIFADLSLRNFSTSFDVPTRNLPNAPTSGLIPNWSAIDKNSFPAGNLLIKSCSKINFSSICFIFFHICYMQPGIIWDK